MTTCLCVSVCVCERKRGECQRFGGQCFNPLQWWAGVVEQDGVDLPYTCNLRLVDNMWSKRVTTTFLLTLKPTSKFMQPDNYNCQLNLESGWEWLTIAETSTRCQPLYFCESPPSKSELHTTTVRQSIATPIVVGASGKDAATAKCDGNSMHLFAFDPRFLSNYLPFH